MGSIQTLAHWERDRSASNALMALPCECMFYALFVRLQNDNKTNNNGTGTVKIESTMRIYFARSLPYISWKGINITSCVAQRQHAAHTISHRHFAHCHDGDGIYYISVDVNSCLGFLFRLLNILVCYKNYRVSVRFFCPCSSLRWQFGYFGFWFVSWVTIHFLCVHRAADVLK